MRVRQIQALASRRGIILYGGVVASAGIASAPPAVGDVASARRMTMVRLMVRVQHHEPVGRHAHYSCERAKAALTQQRARRRAVRGAAQATSARVVERWLAVRAVSMRGSERRGCGGRKEREGGSARRVVQRRRL